MRSTAAGVARRSPRRSQPPDPVSWFRRGELAAALAAVMLIAELLLVPALVLVTVILVAVGSAARWRPHWLALPLGTGVCWLAAAGPSAATAALAAGLPRALPAALVAGAAQAGLLLWLRSRRAGTGWRPGLVAATRRRFARAGLTAGHTVTRSGCALGLDAGTGALAGFDWADAEHGVLLAGTDPGDLLPLGLAVGCAALRRRKTVLVLDLAAPPAGATGQVAALAGRLGVPATWAPPGGGALTATVGHAIRARSVVLARGGPALVGDVAAALTRLRQLCLRADCLLWVDGSGGADPAALAALFALGPAVGTAVLVSTTSAACARALAPVAAVTVACGALTPELAEAVALATVASPAAGPLARQRPGAFTLIGSGSVQPGCAVVPISTLAPAVGPRSLACRPGPGRPRFGSPGCARPPGSCDSLGLSVSDAAGIGWPPAGVAWAPRGRFRPELVYLGWRSVAEPDPGPPPAPPPPAEPDRVSQDWLAAQRREQARLDRPARLATAAAGAAAVAITASWLTGLLPSGVALVTGAVAATAAGRGAAELWRGRHVLAGRLRAEERRVGEFRAAQRAALAAGRHQYARQVRDWQQRTAAAARRPQWQPVTVPTSVGRIDVAGGTLAGWSALLATLAGARLAADGDVTVVDLTEGGVAGDLLTAARHGGVEPQVWVLPADLPRLDLGTDFDPELLADVLARTVAAARRPGQPPHGAYDPARDAALLGLVLRALGDGATMAQLTAALRAVGQLGAAAEHLGSAGLAPEQLARLAAIAGRGASQFVIDQAAALEARLRALSPLATAPIARPATGLRVAWLDRRVAPLVAEVLAAYLVIALAETLRRNPAAVAPWQQAIVVLGAERLPADVLDRLSDAAEVTRTGLVLGYRSVPPHVRDRLGRGDAAVAFMRLGNAADARLAAEQIGTEHRFVISQLTDTVAASVSDTAGGSYTSTVGAADSVADSRSVTETVGRSRGRGSTRSGGFLPFAGGGSASRDRNRSAARSRSVSVSAGINAGTSWGLSTSRAVGTTGSVSAAAQRAREFLVEARELQRLPPSAVVLCRPGSGEPQVVLADANPAISTLPTATLAIGRPCGPG